MIKIIDFKVEIEFNELRIYKNIIEIIKFTAIRKLKIIHLRNIC